MDYQPSKSVVPTLLGDYSRVSQLTPFLTQLL